MPVQETFCCLLLPKSLVHCFRSAFPIRLAVGEIKRRARGSRKRPIPAAKVPKNLFSMSIIFREMRQRRRLISSYSFYQENFLNCSVRVTSPVHEKGTNCPVSIGSSIEID